MFDVNDILALLNDGADIAELAQQAADTLNAAQQAYKEQQEAERKKKLAEEKLQKEKKEATRNLITDIAQYLYKFFPGIFADLNEVNDFIEAVDIDETIKAFEELSKTAVMLKNTFNSEDFQTAVKSVLPPKEKKQTRIEIAADHQLSKAIKEFLAENNLL